ncbi:MAG TPA: hypothetical protein VGF94_10755 [Kofleriaceae bacterium]|jgi:hypothetical protein
MRTTVLASVLCSLVLPGCIGLGCGGYTGGGDEVYARGEDQLILCDNGGFVATTSAAGTIEGRFDDANLVEGSDGAVVSQLVYETDGTLLTPALGANAWQPVDEGKTGLDHADALCQALATRTWWNQ